MLDAGARARFRKHRAAVAGAILVGSLLLFALLGPLFAGHDPYTSDFVRGAEPDGTPVGPSAAFWLGADRLFRDELARLAYGARLSLLIGLAATAMASLIGAVVGIVSGWYEGTAGVRLVPGLSVNADMVLMRLVDVGLSFPFLLLVMAIGAALEKTTIGSILVTLGVTGWLGTARVLRAKTMQVRSLDFVVASRALGQSTLQILLRHVLPNVAGPLIVIATASVAQMIIAESVLSYLGVGISPPTATWGHMLFEGQDYYLAAPWLVASPAIAILLAVLGFNLLGEGLRDALDPRGD
jgi:ABC-type dipeptide/oligopeptide/nickel transport system permease subunit